MADMNPRSRSLHSVWVLLLAVFISGYTPPARAGTSGEPRADGGANGASGPARDTVALAIRYESGLSVPRDYGRAFALYCEAARRGDARAFYGIGWMYLNGRGVPRDDALAVMWLRRAADRGIAQAANLVQLLSRVSPAPVQDCPRPVERLRQAGISPRASAPPAIRSVIDETAQNLGVNARLLHSVVSVESGFDPNAVSPKMAAGLMQLMPATAERFGVRDRFDPRENMRGGATYLRWLISRYKGDLTLALAAYNAGEAKVDEFGGMPPYEETRAYVAAVKRLCGCGAPDAAPSAKHAASGKEPDNKNVKSKF
jgi:hypothetical protein